MKSRRRSLGAKLGAKAKRFSPGTSYDKGMGLMKPQKLTRRFYKPTKNISSSGGL